MPELTKKQKHFLDDFGVSICRTREFATSSDKPEGLSRLGSTSHGDLFRQKSTNTLWIKRQRFCWGVDIYIKLPED